MNGPDVIAAAKTTRFLIADKLFFTVLFVILISLVVISIRSAFKNADLEEKCEQKHGMLVQSRSYGYLCVKIERLIE